MEFVPLSHTKKEGTRPSKKTKWQLGTAIVHIFFYFAILCVFIATLQVSHLKLTFRPVYRLTKS
jgi:hypothetical protein